MGKSLSERRWPSEAKLGGRFGYFLFFLLGDREGGVRGRRGGGGGVRFLLKIPEGGVSPMGEGVCGELGILGGGGPGGAKDFFSGPKCPPSKPLNC